MVWTDERLVRLVCLGHVPVEPGSGEVVLGSPMFKRTVIRPEGALEATEIRARGLSDAAKYITGLRWRAQDFLPVLKRAFVPVSDLTQGIF